MRIAETQKIMNKIILIFLSIFCICTAFSQGLSFSGARGNIINGRISPGGSFSATDEDGNFINGHVSPGGQLHATDINGNFINGNISPSGFFSGTDSSGNFLNGKVKNQDVDILNINPRANKAESHIINPTEPFDFSPEDDLDKATRAVQILDTLDRMDRQAQQSALQQQQLNLQERQLNLEKQRLERMNEQWKLDQWKDNRAREAASYAAAEIYKIDVTTPDGEKKLNDWILYTRANGVSEDSLKIIFGGKIRERDLHSELRYKYLIESLGSDGMLLYDALVKERVPPDQASVLAKRSKKAEKIFSDLKKLAIINGIIFEIPIEEMAKIKKRVGEEGGYQDPISGNYFDASTYCWDLDALFLAFNTYANQKLKELYAQNPDNN